MFSRTIRPTAVVLLDFLAPTLLNRTSRYASAASVNALPLFPTAFKDKVKENVPVLNTRGGAKPLNAADAAFFNQTLVTIRRAVPDGDIASLMKCLRILEKRQLFQLIPQLDLKEISEVIRIASTKRDLSSTQRKMAEEIALLAAMHNEMGGLIWCLFAYIKIGEPDSVITLYNRFSQSRIIQDVSEDQNIEEETEEQDSTVNSDKLSVLLAITTAHAMKGSFSAALSTYLASPFRFNRYMTEQYLESMKAHHDDELVRKVTLYLERLKVARLALQHNTLTKQIQNLANTDAIKPLQSLYRGIINGLSGPDAYIAVDESSINETKPVALNTVVWTTFLTAFLKCGNKELAGGVWDDLEKLGLKPTVSMWTAVIDAYGRTNAISDAISAWNGMKSQGINPDVLAYRAIISALCKGSQFDSAFTLFEEFQQTFEKITPPEQGMAVYNTFVHGLLWASKTDAAFSVMNNMLKKGPAPDLVTYNTFLRYFSRRRDFRNLANIMNTMTKAKITGDVFTFSTILTALLRAGKKDAPELVLQLMRKQGIEPNTATYTSIIHHQLQERNEENLHSVLRLLQVMEKEPGTEPNEVTYTAILSGVCADWLSPEKQMRWRDEIIERMHRRGIKFTLPIYHITLKLYLYSSDEEGLRTAIFYYQEMKKRHIQFQDATWYILLAGLVHRRAWGVADEVVRDMKKTGHKLYSLI